MLEVGNGGMKLNEYQAEFALWCIFKAPLLIGCDVRSISQDYLNILSNEEVIAVNQDKLGKQGKLVSTSLGVLGLRQVISCELENNSTAVLFFNRGLVKEKIKVKFSVVGFKQSKGQVRDLINHKDLGVMSDSITMDVESKSVQMVKLSLVDQSS